MPSPDDKSADLELTPEQPQAPDAPPPEKPPEPSVDDANLTQTMQDAFDKAAQEQMAKDEPSPKPEAPPKKKEASPKPKKAGETSVDKKADVPFDGLKEVFKEKSAAPAEESPEETVRLARDLMGDHRLGPRTSERMQKLTAQLERVMGEKTEKENLLREREAALAERETLLKELEAKAAAPVLSDEDKRLMELGKAAAWVNDPENQAEIKEKFDSKIAARDKEMDGIVSQFLSDEGKAVLQKAGGWRNYMLRNGAGAEKFLNESVPFADRQEIAALFQEAKALARERQEYIKQNQDQGSKLFAERQQSLQKREAEQKQQQEKQRAEVEKFQAAIEKDSVIYQKIEIPDEATPEERKKLESDIKAQSTLRDYSRKVFEGDREAQQVMLRYAHEGIVAILENRLLKQRLADMQKKHEARESAAPAAPKHRADRRSNVEEPPKRTEAKRTQHGEDVVLTNMERAAREQMEKMLNQSP